MSIASKCTCGTSLNYCNGSPNCKKGNLMFQAANELNRAAERIIELEKVMDRQWIAVAIDLPDFDFALKVSSGTPASLTSLAALGG